MKVETKLSRGRKRTKGREVRRWKVREHGGICSMFGVYLYGNVFIQHNTMVTEYTR